MSYRPVIIAVVAALAVGLAACSGSGGSVTTADVWARPGSAGGGDRRLPDHHEHRERGGHPRLRVEPERRLGRAARVDHGRERDDGHAPIDGIEIPAGGSVTLEPGGKHLMVMGLTTDLTVGGTLDLDLVFQNAGTIKVTAEVKQP